MIDTGKWPALPLAEWRGTRDTLQLWLQIIGKVRMSNTPLINHWWNVPLYVTARGLTTSLMWHRDGERFQIDVDLREHALHITTVSGPQRSMPLLAGPVSAFYTEFMSHLDALGLGTTIWAMPVEIPDAIPFTHDERHTSYDPEQALQFWLALTRMVPVLERFRSGFVGKASSVHLFWGGLDLATTRFSGRTAPPHPGGAPNCGPHVMLEAYSHETDETEAFEVRVSVEALAEARAEARRGERVRGPEIETGGMLLGAIDDATGIVYVDKGTGPPPDSYLSATYFQHGIEGVQERVESESDRTARTTGFIGFWHSHPAGRAWPSPTDEQGMASIVAPDGTTRRALMMILGGQERRWVAWRNGDAGALPDIYLRVVPRSAGPVAAGHPAYVGGLDLQQPPPGSYFRGGYGGRVRVDRGGHPLPGETSRSRGWWPWQRRRS